MNNAIKSFVKTFAVMMTVGMLALSSAALVSILPSINFGQIVTPLVKPPFECEGLHAVVFYDEGARLIMPSNQIAAFEGADVRDWAHANAKEFLALDKDVAESDLTAPWVKAAWKSYKEKSGGKLPWIVVSNGKTGESSEYPSTPTDAIALLSKYAEKK